MKVIILGKHSGECMVDDCDYEYLNQFYWHFDGKYARASIGGKKVRMHRLILPEAKIIDHKDGNGINNTRANLRECTNKQNCGNYGPRGKYKGVSKFGNKYMAKIANRYLGLFETPELAAIAYNEAAKKYFGEFAYLNII